MNFNNNNSYLQQSGTIPGSNIMGISPVKVKGGQVLPFAQAIGKITQDNFIDNSYDSAYLMKLKMREVSMTGEIQYVFKPAALPVSNYAQTDAGNRSFGTELQVYGKPILWLQTNFWTNEFVNTTDPKYIPGIQEMLLTSYAKSISITKGLLAFQEATLFSLASGQFYFVDELGRTADVDPLDPNDVDMGAIAFTWSTQQPTKIPQQTYLGNTSKAFLQRELNMMSKWLMNFPLSINTFAIGYDLDKIHIDCSYYMRSNLANAINLGWPTETNVKVLNNKSFDNAYLSNWLNITLTNTGTFPYLQNSFKLVQQEQAPTSGNGGGSILGFGVNNINDFSYLNNVVAYISMEGSMECYTTPYVPFNPYTNSKTWYRLGGTWGWGQVHLPILSATNYALIDSNTYITINSRQSEATTKPNQDWVAASTNNNAATNPTYQAIKIVNGIQYTVNYTIDLEQLLDDMTQAQAIEQLWEGGMEYDVYNFPTLPTTIDGYVNTNANNEVIGGLQNKMTFATWAQYRSFKALNKTFINSKGKAQQLMTLNKIGQNQFTFADFNLSFGFPQDTPVAP